MDSLQHFTNKVFNGDARRLLAALPTDSIDAVITDPMYGTAKNFKYEWGIDPGRSSPEKHWHHHEPMYRECLRVLKPGGVLAWAQGAKFCPHFRTWFGGHRLWTLTRFRIKGMNATGHTWIVQTKEQKPVDFPASDSLVIYQDCRALKKYHPCPKPVEELQFMIKSLTTPGQVVLDCFCGLGSTLVAAELLDRRWIGCDLSKTYCQVAMKRLENLRSKGVA